MEGFAEPVTYIPLDGCDPTMAVEVVDVEGGVELHPP